MSSYLLNREGEILRVAFGTPADNSQLVRDCSARLVQMLASGELAGGPRLLINGPASLPVAMVIAHAVVHRYAVVGVFDPKMGKYVVVASHGSPLSVGDVVEV